MSDPWTISTSSPDVAGGLARCDPDGRNGYSGIQVRFAVDADATSAVLRAIVAQTQERSRLFDIPAA